MIVVGFDRFARRTVEAADKKRRDFFRATRFFFSSFRLGFVCAVVIVAVVDFQNSILSR